MSATRAVIDFVQGTSIDTLPAELLAEGRRCVTDTIGVILAGSTERSAAIVRDQVEDQGGRPEAAIFGSALRAPAALAARANGTAGHAMDFDDTQLPSRPDRVFGLLTHPSVAPLSAALAVGERRNVSGAGLLEAFLIGFEVECKIAEAIDPRHYLEGFHSTATIGTLGAAVTAAKLEGLDGDRLAMTLGLAASMASGIRLGFGTMTKPLHAGRAAENGILAADLAARGFTAGEDGLEAPWGFFRVFGGGFDERYLVGALGAPYSLLVPGVSVKPYPSGSLGHPSTDAMLALVREHDLTPEDIRLVTFRAGHNILRPLRYLRPANALEAKFSIPFFLSSIILRRRAGIEEFTDAFVASRPVREMMERVVVEFDTAIDARGYDRMRSEIDVELTDGTVLRTSADTYRGGPMRPLTRDELHLKFRDCAGLVLEEPRVAAALERLERLEDLERLPELIAFLGGAPDTTEDRA